MQITESRRFFMDETGVVERLFGDKIVVRIRRASACGENCASCGGSCSAFQDVTALNKSGAGVGDTVTLHMPSSRVLAAAFLVYILPLAVLFAGYAAAYSISHSEGISILVGVLVMALSFALIRAADKRLKCRYMPVAVKTDKEKA